jgi:hypothetical protein
LLLLVVVQVVLIPRVMEVAAVAVVFVQDYLPYHLDHIQLLSVLVVQRRVPLEEEMPEAIQYFQPLLLMAAVVEVVQLIPQLVRLAVQVVVDQEKLVQLVDLDLIH